MITQFFYVKSISPPTQCVGISHFQNWAILHVKSHDYYFLSKWENFAISRKKILISPIWFLNFLAYAEKFFSVTRWIGQIELHVTSASELPITWFRSIHWNFPLKYEIEIFKKKPQVCILPFEILGPQMTRRVWLYEFQPFKKIKVWIFEILLIWHFNFLNTKYERLNLPNNH